MNPAHFRRLPRWQQIEMMAHRREHMLRQSHSEHVSQIVAKMDDPTEDKPKPPGRR